MTNKKEPKDKKAETDFFDWWDSFESKVIPMDKMPKSMGERVNKASSRA